MIEENKQAVLLLSSHFTRAKKGDPTPLTSIEYGRFARWLKENDFQPKDLFHQFESIQDKWIDPKGKITKDRLQFLLGRGMAMGVALEKWQSAGIWVITRSDKSYPPRLKKHFGENAPAVLFGVGNERLLNAGGLCIVGSRNIDEADQQYTAKVAHQAAIEGLNIVSGGARGVDETAMTKALEIEGTALGILANDLFKTALSSKWRQYIKGNQLALISPFYPEASFHVGNAMGRNKYIYGLSDYALVVRSEEGKGGTWAGAIQNCKKGWVPLFVKAQSDATGNLALVALGASQLQVADESMGDCQDWLLAQLSEEASAGTETELSKPLGQQCTIDTEMPVTPTKLEVEDDAPHTTVSERAPMPFLSQATDTEMLPATSDEEQAKDPYQEFVSLLLDFLNQHDQVTLSMLKEQRKDLKLKQITAWLDQCSDEGLIERKGKRRTYILKSDGGRQSDLFG